MYKKSALIIYLLFTSCVQIWSQNGVLKGVVADRHSNEGLIGAIIQLQNTQIAVESDLDGGYLLNAPAGVYTLLVSYGDTYVPDTLKGVEIVSNKIILKNLTLVPIINDMGTITFVQKIKKDDAMGTLIEKKKETGTSDNVDSKTLSKSAASNVSDGLKKVTGASIQDGKFAIIRGMSDRYNAGYINGSPLPSTEADKKAFSFD